MVSDLPRQTGDPKRQLEKEKENNREALSD